MRDSEGDQFATAWSALSEVLSGARQSDAAIALAFSVLREYELTDVLSAMSEHARSESWMPRPAELIERIKPTDPELTDDYLIDLAHAYNTMLGCVVYTLISDFTMRHGTRLQQLDTVKTKRGEIDQFIAAFKQRRLKRYYTQLLKSKGFRSHHGLLDVVVIDKTVPESLEYIEDKERNQLANSGLIEFSDIVGQVIGGQHHDHG